MKKPFLTIVVAISLFGVIPSVSAAGSHLYFAPAEGTFFIGSTFDISVFVDTGGNDINAVQVDIKFDPNKLQMASPTTGKSIISVWIAQPSYSNKDGMITFKGGIPSPGINASAGLISTITFRAIATGTTFISFRDSSRVLLNDGKGTNVLTSKGRGVYTIVVPPPEGPEVFSSTHPNQNKWYKNNNPTFSWEKEEGVTDFSYDFNQDPYGAPDNESEGEQTSVSYNNVGEGVSYFHIKARKGASWGGITHYAVQIDSSPPAAFEPVVEPSPETTERQPLVSFITTDYLSGIDHYELKYIDVTREKEEKATGFFIEVTSPYRLPALETGRYLVIVRAYDAAGNYQDGKVKIQIFPEGIFFTEKGIHFRGIVIPWLLVIIIILIILLLIVLFIIFLTRKKREQEKRERERLEEMKKKMENYQQEIFKEAIK